MVSPRYWLTAAALLLAAPLSAQYQSRAWLEWRTLEAGRFAVHFPAELEPWARRVAGKITGIDSVVGRMVGFEPGQRVDIVVDDPFRIPNGSAWPLLEAPRIVLWATPPNPRNDIGTYVSWTDMLATHEFAHLAHLLRPTRNPTQAALWKLSPLRIGPISRKVPRWVIEGYATYIEGRVTGSGRPNGVWRPTILREWAIEGALPAYGQLNATSGMYGGDFAYLAGSSFLEWLAARRGDSSLVALWRRLSARADRGFVEAFAGVYGEGPDILYGRFAAELTAAAKQREAEVRRQSADTGATIQHLARETGDPAISRDGGRAAISLASATRPARVVIWRTIPDPDSMAERAAGALLARDPEDVAPFRPFPPPKRAIATLHAVGGQPYEGPRFFADGRVLVWRNTAIGDGSWTPDLYVWDPQRKSVHRITTQANVTHGDPAPDGKTVAATRCAAGKCDLVSVNVATGAVAPLADGNDTRSFYRPRFSRDGQSIALAVHDAGYWRVGLFEMATRTLRILTGDPRDYFDVAFADDSTMVAAADENGLLNIVRLRTDGRVIGRVTNVSGAAVAPEVNPADGSLWFLSLHARGWDVRATRADALPLMAAAPGARPRELPTAPTGSARGYSPKRKTIYFPTASFVRDGGNVGIGLANTDPVGRDELLLQAAKSIAPHSRNASLEGAALTLTSRRRTPTVLSAFSVTQGGPFGYSIRGGSLAAERSRRLETTARRVLIGGTWSSLEDRALMASEPVSRWLVFGDLSASATRFNNGRRTTLSLAMHGDGGRLGDRSASRALLTAGLTSTEIPFAFATQQGYAGAGAPFERFTIGGSPPALLPPGVVSQYIPQPVLSPFFTGQRLETYRLSVPFARGRAYGWAGRAFDDGVSASFERVIGIEWSASFATVPPLGTPAARATFGAGRWMNERQIVRLGSGAGYVTPNSPFAVYFTAQFGDWAR